MDGLLPPGVSQRLMTLLDFSAPDDSANECHVCLSRDKLSREHVPPQAAFNKQDIFADSILLPGRGRMMPIRRKLRGGLWVQSLCERCNTLVCAPYAEQYVAFAKWLDRAPQLFGPQRGERYFRVPGDTLLLAKEIATMILAIEPITYSVHNKELRHFVHNREAVVEPPFRVLAFLVKPVKEAGTAVRFHSRVSSFMPGWGFTGGEISWYPFGFVYASEIERGYEPERLTDITHWFREGDPTRRRDTWVPLYTRITGGDGLGGMSGWPRRRPQIDQLG